MSGNWRRVEWDTAYSGDVTWHILKFIKSFVLILRFYKDRVVSFLIYYLVAR